MSATTLSGRLRGCPGPGRGTAMSSTRTWNPSYCLVATSSQPARDCPQRTHPSWTREAKGCRSRANAILASRSPLIPQPLARTTPTKTPSRHRRPLDPIRRRDPSRRRLAGLSRTTTPRRRRHRARIRDLRPRAPRTRLAGSMTACAQQWQYHPQITAYPVDAAPHPQLGMRIVHKRHTHVFMTWPSASPHPRK